MSKEVLIITKSSGHIRTLQTATWFSQTPSSIQFFVLEIKDLGILT
jgi:hypothetical protein